MAKARVRSGRLAALAGLSLSALLATSAFGQPATNGDGTLSGMRFYDAEQLTPADAKASFFDPISNTATYAWSSTKPWEIAATAAALENDPQKIFAFVKNNIRFEPRFGAQKGAVGALIDRSGTAFDQAQLLVELLRAAGVTAAYEVGTLELTGEQFADWVGVTDPAAARQFLANGGVPATVVGTGSITSVTMAHAWVSASVGGGSPVVLDPSYKKMQRWSQIDIADKASFSASAFVSAAATTTGSGAEGGVNYITGVNLSGAKTQLDSAASQLLTSLRGDAYREKRREEIGGGARIIRLENPWGDATTGTLSATWGTYTGGLPDKYRTKVTVAAQNCQAALFADEIYGRRLTFRSRKTKEVGPPQVFNSIGYDAFMLNGAPLPGDTLVGYAASSCSQTPAVNGVSIAVNLPYAAHAAGGGWGSWMDRTSFKEIDFGEEAQIVLGWGEAGSELQARVSDDFGLSIPWSIPEGGPPPGPVAAEYYGPAYQGAPYGPPVGNAKLYAAWLAQMTRAVGLLEGVSQSRIQHHYTVGAVYTQTQRQVHDLNDNDIDDGEPVIPGTQVDSGTRINIDSGFSTTSLTGSAPEKLATRHTIAALGAMLEGSLFEQQLDSVETMSTAQRFPWAQENLASSVRYHRLLPGSTAPQEYRKGEVATYSPPCRGLDTANHGYVVIQPNDRYLGPASTKWDPPTSAFSGMVPQLRRAPQSDYWMQRGCAWVAFNTDASEIAHIVTSVDREFKGAGGGSKKDADDRNPPDQGDLLKDKFKDRSNVDGVDLRTGAFTYKPPVDLVVGQGEFPYSLSFQRVFQAGGATCPKCVAGWTHNFDIRATVSGGGLEGMGETTPLSLASPLVGIKAAFELYKSEAGGLAQQTAALGVMRWLSERLTYNVVTVTQGASSEMFVRVADGTFAAPPTSQSTLTQTGTRQKWDTNQRHGRSPVWLYDPVSFVRTSGSGDQISFQWREWNPTEIPWVKNDFGSVKGFAQGFFANTWTFPKGVTLNFTYCNEAPVIYGGEPGIQQVSSLSTPCADRLTRVSNNLGLWLDIDRLNASSSDGRSTFVTTSHITSPSFQDGFYPIERHPYVASGFVDVSGKRRAYEWEAPALTERPSSAVRLVRVRAPTDYSGGVKAVNDTVSTPEDTPKVISPLANDLPAFGLRLGSLSQPQNGTAVRGDGTITYTPNSGFVGQEMLTYLAVDENGASSMATITINVTGAGGGGSPCPPGQELQGTVCVTPPSGGGPVDLCINILDVQETVPPGKVRIGQECFDANRPPAPADKTYTFIRNGASFFTPFVDPLAEERNSDPDGDTIDWAPGGVPADFVQNSPYKNLQYTNLAFTYGGPREYTYTVRDSHGATASAKIYVNVPDQEPVVVNDSYTWDPTINYGYLRPLDNDYDPEGNTLTIVSWINYPPELDPPVNNVIRIQGQAGTSYSFDYVVSDGHNQKPGHISITIENTGGCREGLPCN